MAKKETPKVKIPFLALKSFSVKVMRTIDDKKKPGKTKVIESTSESEYVEGMSYTFRGDPAFRKQLKQLQADGKVAVMGAL